MATIDEYSLAAIPIELIFNSTNLGVGTAFVWAQDNQHFLITNWHNVSGKDPNTGKHVLKSAAEPNKIQAWFNHKGQLGNKIAKSIAIRDANDAPLWFVHPAHGNKVDVVALPLETYPDVEMYAINTLSNDNLLVQIGMDVFVIGFPFGIGPGGLPIWKRGSIASEPELSPAPFLNLFIDTASRPGMSGSPVVRRSWGTHMMAGNNIAVGTNTATKFLGVYSGRIASQDPLDAQLQRRRFTQSTAAASISTCRRPVSTRRSPR